MKSILFLLALIFSTYCFSQKKLPVINSSSKFAIIFEEGQLSTRWNLSPETKIDAYTTNKLTKPTVIKLKTDVDSISITLKEGQYKDFIVLLNGKDSCYTRFQSPKVKDYRKHVPQIHDTIPFVINKYNTNYIKVIINKTDTINLNFDTGATELTIIEDALKNKVKGDIHLYNTLHDIEIGKRFYKTKIYDIKLAGHEVDGLLGWDIFDGMVVELNYDKNIMVVHSRLPKAVKRDKGAVKLNIRYFNHRFFMEAQIAQNGTTVKNWFLFDTGYQKTIMLDNDLLKQENFPIDKMEFINKVIMHGTIGNEVPVITSNLHSLKIGKYELKNIPAQIMTTSKTQFGSNIHILGSEVLKRFNTYLDFQNNAVYLIPNSHYDEPYIDRS
ncbi:aspartyl protease family protein [Flavobacterium cerinum]|uniref:Peptidase A2 domain-containing protein n=1 Tax=Flavobacterium cerinum TaxID=2502784 RepID=A0A3S3Q7F9_9FLAO|nr:aspartyl protease family protein [Flavobacterium cerinum]RWW91720.1 hypothetical protein EPI11_18295 [Flavobacterium cerinum]